MGGKRGVVLLFLSLVSASAGGDRVDDAPERIVPAGEDVEFRCPAEGQGGIGNWRQCCNIFYSSSDH